MTRLLQDEYRYLLDRAASFSPSLVKKVASIIDAAVTDEDIAAAVAEAEKVIDEVTAASGFLPHHYERSGS